MDRTESKMLCTFLARLAGGFIIGYSLANVLQDGGSGEAFLVLAAGVLLSIWGILA